MNAGYPHGVHNARIETLTNPDGTTGVVAMFDLSETEVAACAHAVGVARTEQFRHEELSADDVLAMRELTGLADELSHLAGHAGAVTMMLTPARLMALRERARRVRGGPRGGGLHARGGPRGARLRPRAGPPAGGPERRRAAGGLRELAARDKVAARSWQSRACRVRRMVTTRRRRTRPQARPSRARARKDPDPVTLP